MVTRTFVIGLGNPLMADDGLGAAVIEAMTDRVPLGVELIDGGVAGVGLIHWMEEAERIVFVDAARMGLVPGTVKVFSPDAVKNMKSDREFSLHGLDVLSLIAMAKVIGIQPAITIVGVEPFMIAPQFALSDGMTRIIEKVVKTVLEAIARKPSMTE